MNRKLLAVILAVVLSVPLLSGCSKKTAVSSSSSESSSSPSSNIKADYIVQPSLNYGEYMPFSNGFAVVSNNKSSDQVRYAFMDRNGKLLGDGFIYKDARNFNDDGLAVVKCEDDTYAFIDKTGKKVLDSIGGQKFNAENGIPDDFVNGLSVVSVNKDNNLVSAVINTKGDIVIPFDFTNNYHYDRFADNVSVRTTPGKQYAVVDTTGKVLFTSDNELEMNTFSDDVNFYTQESGQEITSGIIDKSGKKITEPIYALEVRGFVNGLFFATYTDPSKGNAFIDTNGNVQFTIPDITDAKIYDTVIVAKGKDGLKYIYDRTGKKLCDKGFTEITSFSGGVGTVYENEKWGLIDNEGNYILQPQDDDYGNLTCSGNLVIVVQNGKMGILQIQ